MQKIVELRDVTSGHGPGPFGQTTGNAPSPRAAVPSIEPIYAVIDSLSRTLECIKGMCASVPNGPVREKLEIERTNLVIGLFVARIAAMRVSPTDAESAVAEPKLPLARRG